MSSPNLYSPELRKLDLTARILKTCARCGETKLLSEFYSKGRCRECRKEQFRSYNQAHPEKGREWRANNPDKWRAYAREWSANNPEKRMLSQARKRASDSGLPFNIELSDITIPKTCPYLGIPLIVGGSKGNRPSLDRIDNTKGYIKGNVIVVSWRANLLKRDATSDELRRIADAVDWLTISLHQV